MMQPYIRSFMSLSKHDAAMAGGKGASLGEMTRFFGGQAQAHNPVPPGFVVLADTFDHFVEQAGIKADIEAELATVNVHDTNSVERASERIRAMFEAAPVASEISSKITRAFDDLARTSRHTPGESTPPQGSSSSFFVAVRSSATAEDSSAASWAGELETYLYTTKSTLLDQVKKCWSSLFTPRAIFYRAEKLGLPTHPDPGTGLTAGDSRSVSVAVVVQAMVPSEVSGVCFTVHPVTKDPNHLIIEAGWGLGEAIVGGLITPDSYVVDKRDFTILDTYVSEQTMKIVRKPDGGTVEHEVPITERERQKLSNGRVVELAKLCQRIEVHYGSPQDIEWALADGKLWITQSRPITTL